MGDAWLDGVQRVPNAKSEGGTYVADVPWRFTGHTTEVVPSGVAGAVALAGRHEFPPHLWAWPEEDWLVQTVRLDRSAFALKHPAGTPETNKMRALQVEVIGFARDMDDKPDAYWDWIGVNVVRRLIDAGYAIDLRQIAPTTGNDGAGTGGAVRMSRAAWRAFGGLSVHANVPDNAHWDMGKANLTRVAQAAGGDQDMAFTPQQEKDIADAASLIVRGAAGVGVPSWAQVALSIDGVEQPGRESLRTFIKKADDAENAALLAAISGIPAKTAALIPAGGGASPAQIQAACEAAIVAQLGFLKPGQ